MKPRGECISFALYLILKYYVDGPMMVLTIETCSCLYKKVVVFNGIVNGLILLLMMCTF